MFRHLTGSSFSYTDGSQLYLVPVFSWTDVRGVGGDWGPLEKETEKKGDGNWKAHWMHRYLHSLATASVKWLTDVTDPSPQPCYMVHHKNFSFNVLKIIESQTGLWWKGP